MLEDHLSQYVKQYGFPGYTELRAQQNTLRRANLLNGNLVANESNRTGGFSARVVQKGSYGFASSTDYSADMGGLHRVVQAAATNANFLDSRLKRGRKDFEPVKPFTRKDGLEEDLPISPASLIAYISELEAYIVERYPKLLSRGVMLNCLDMEKLLYTSDGVVSHSFTPRSILKVSLTAQDKDGSPVDLYQTYGGYGNFNHVFDDPQDYFAAVDALYEEVMHKAEGVWPEPGEQQVILHPDLAGILAHEAVGHTVEADFVQSGSVGGPNLNKRVASDLVTMIDYAHHIGDALAPVPVFVDDEGMPGQDVTLIENGILKAFMHNKETAENMEHAPMGNARAFAFSDEPLIRMRNTGILPGTSKLEEMIASVKNGYYFIKSGNGQADSTGEFMFSVNAGYQIKDGKLAQPIKETTISGVAFEVLKTVEMVSDDNEWTCSGMCGKKQPIPVGMGGPAMKVRINVGGR